MSADSPASLLITPDRRRRLQQRYEEAVRLMSQRPADHARAHELLAECLRADPGNILYVDALLANLRHRQPEPRSSLLASWFGNRRVATLVSSGRWWEALQAAPDALWTDRYDLSTLKALTVACESLHLPEAQVRYLRAACSVAPDDSDLLAILARALTRQGHFDEAIQRWNDLHCLDPEHAEAKKAIEDWRCAASRDPGTLACLEAEIEEHPTSVDGYVQLSNLLAHWYDFEAAEDVLARARSACGGDLRIRDAQESLRLARSTQRVLIAERRAKSDEHPHAKELVARLQLEQICQEIEILHLRCERLPGDMHLRLELAQKLKQAGNYSGAIQRLEEARRDPSLAAKVLLELGECWQHLRQFDKALDFYRQTIAAADERRDLRPLVAALYRVGVLAGAMGKNAEGREALTRLVALEPGFKDARERLDKLPPN